MTITINAKDFNLSDTDKEIELTITQDAYISHDDTQPYNTVYAGSAKDKDGNEYSVTWRLNDGFNPHTDEDESDACDWDNPWTIELV